MFLTHAQVAALADAAGAHGTFIRTLAYIGLRWSEVTAVRVRDVDFDRRRLDIRRAFAYISGQIVEGTPKNHQERTVPLAPWLCEELRPLVEGRGPLLRTCGQNAAKTKVTARISRAMVTAQTPGLH